MRPSTGSPVHVVIHRPSLVPPGRACVAQRAEQVASAGGVHRAGPSQHDLEWRARIVATMSAHVRHQVADLFDRRGVAMARGQEQRSRAVPRRGAAHRSAMRPVPADPNRDPWTLHRPRQQDHVVHLVMATVMRDRVARPIAVQQGESFVQALGEQSQIGRLAEACVLVVDRAAQAGAEDHPPAAQVVKCRHLARDLLRASPWYWGDHRAELDPCRRERRSSEQHPGVAKAAPAPLVVDHVIPDEERVPSGGLRRRRHLRDRLRIREVAEVRNVDGEAHASLLDGHAPQHFSFARAALRACRSLQTSIQLALSWRSV